MSNVIQFPATVVDDWQRVEAQIRTLLDEHGTEPDVAEQVVGAMEQVFENFARDFTFTVELPFSSRVPRHERDAVKQAVNTAFEDLKRQLAEHARQLLIERLVRELEVARSAVTVQP